MNYDIMKSVDNGEPKRVSTHNFLTNAQDALQNIITIFMDMHVDEPGNDVQISDDSFYFEYNGGSIHYYIVKQMQSSDVHAILESIKDIFNKKSQFRTSMDNFSDICLNDILHQLYITGGEGISVNTTDNMCYIELNDHHEFKGICDLMFNPALKNLTLDEIYAIPTDLGEPIKLSDIDLSTRYEIFAELTNYINNAGIVRA